MNTEPAMPEPAPAAALWTTDLYFFVDGMTQGLACARFYQVVCAPIEKACREEGVRIRSPRPLQPQRLWQDYLQRHYRPYPPPPLGLLSWLSRLPSLDAIDAQEKHHRGPLPAFPCGLRLVQGIGDADTLSTWEDATRWIWKAFAPPITPKVVLVSVEENRMSSGNGPNVECDGSCH